MREITKAEEELYKETAKILKGTERRVFMARVVKILGHGGQYYVEREFHWNHETIKKGATLTQLRHQIFNKALFHGLF